MFFYSGGGLVAFFGNKMKLESLPHKKNVKETFIAILSNALGDTLLNPNLLKFATN